MKKNLKEFGYERPQIEIIEVELEGACATLSPNGPTLPGIN